MRAALTAECSQRGIISVKIPVQGDLSTKSLKNKAEDLYPAGYTVFVQELQAAAWKLNVILFYGLLQRLSRKKKKIEDIGLIKNNQL